MGAGRWLTQGLLLATLCLRLASSKTIYVTRDTDTGDCTDNGANGAPCDLRGAFFYAYMDDTIIIKANPKLTSAIEYNCLECLYNETALTIIGDTQPPAVLRTIFRAPGSGNFSAIKMSDVAGQITFKNLRFRGFVVSDYLIGGAAISFDGTVGSLEDRRQMKKQGLIFSEYGDYGSPAAPGGSSKVPIAPKIPIKGPSITVSGCEFEDNVCHDSIDGGGAIWINAFGLGVEYGGLFIENSSFHNNSFYHDGTIGGGGAVYFQGTLCHITNTTFSDNKVVEVSGMSEGGAVFLNGYNPTLIKGSNFTGNKAVIGAAGSAPGLFSAVDTVFMNNMANGPRQNGKESVIAGYGFDLKGVTIVNSDPNLNVMANTDQIPANDPSFFNASSFSNSDGTIPFINAPYVFNAEPKIVGGELAYPGTWPDCSHPNPFSHLCPPSSTCVNVKNSTGSNVGYDCQ